MLNLYVTSSYSIQCSICGADYLLVMGLSFDLRIYGCYFGVCSVVRIGIEVLLRRLIYDHGMGAPKMRLSQISSSRVWVGAS